MDSSTLPLASSISSPRESGLILVLSFITEIAVLKANSVDPDQRSTAYNLDPHYLPMALYGALGHKGGNP